MISAPTEAVGGAAVSACSVITPYGVRRFRDGEPVPYGFCEGADCHVRALPFLAMTCQKKGGGKR